MKDFLSEFCSIRNFSFGDDEYHTPIFSIESRTEEFAHEWADLLRWEVHHSDDLLPGKLIFCIMCCYLGARLLYSNFSPEIYPDLIGTLACFREVLHSYDSTDSKLYGFEVLPSYSIHDTEYNERN